VPTAVVSTRETTLRIEEQHTSLISPRRFSNFERSSNPKGSHFRSYFPAVEDVIEVLKETVNVSVGEFSESAFNDTRRS
jgi:hypothetical protein